MARKTVYTPELVDAIVRDIRATGSFRLGIEGKIGHTQFSLWRKKYPGFAEATDRARRQFVRTCPEELTRAAMERLADILENGVVIETSRQNREVKEITDSTGTIVISREVKETATTTTIKKGVPMSAIARVLPPPLNLDNAIALVNDAGYTVIDPTKRTDGDRVRRGLTDETAESVKRMILYGEDEFDADYN